MYSKPVLSIMIRVLYLCIAFLVFLPVSSSAQILPDEVRNGVEIVDHLVIQVPDTNAAFDFFTNSLGLPVAWNLTDYGDFTSGGVSLGNVNLEIIQMSQKSREEGMFPDRYGIIGIAFQPAESLNGSLASLDGKNIRYGQPEPFVMEWAGAPRTLWTNVYFEDFMPETLVFYCNYSFDENKNREKLKSELVQIHGGPGGVVRLSEIGIRYSTDSTRNNWVNFISRSDDETEGLLHAAEDVSIRLIPSESEGLSSLTITVASLEKTESLLSDRAIPYTVRDGILEIMPETLPNVTILIIQ
jgi:catechol 2,3-dioxygenase-like lactoylglutathione lyase family enzyme